MIGWGRHRWWDCLGEHVWFGLYTGNRRATRIATACTRALAPVLPALVALPFTVPSTPTPTSYAPLAGVEMGWEPNPGPGAAAGPFSLTSLPATAPDVTPGAAWANAGSPERLGARSGLLPGGGVVPSPPTLSEPPAFAPPERMFVPVGVPVPVPEPSGALVFGVAMLVAAWVRRGRA